MSLMGWLLAYLQRDRARRQRIAEGRRLRARQVRDVEAQRRTGNSR
jgi:hypothetical protein